MENEVSVWVGQNVKRIREERGLLLGDLAERLTAGGWPSSISSLSKLENGKRGVSVDELDVLARTLGESAAMLMTDPRAVTAKTLLDLVEDLHRRESNRRKIISGFDTEKRLLEKRIQAEIDRHPEAKAYVSHLLGKQAPKSSKRRSK